MCDATGEASDGFHLPGLCELVLGLRQFLVGALSLLIQPAVLERDSRLGGKRHGEREILKGEPLLAAGADAEYPEHLRAEDQRYPEERPVAAAPIGLAVRRRHPGITRRIRHDQRLAGGRDGPGETLAYLQPRCWHRLPGVAIGSGEHQVVLLSDPNPDRVRIEEAPTRFGNLR